MIIKTKKKVIRLYEKQVATKHAFSRSSLIFASILILLILILIGREVVENYSQFYIKMLLRIAFIFLGIACFLTVYFFYLKSKNTPYNKIVYDSKYKWFKIYTKNYYHIFRPTDIIGLKTKSLYKYDEDANQKFFGWITITTYCYDAKVQARVTKKTTISCAKPEEVKTLMRKYINDKLQDNYRRIVIQRKLELMERVRIHYNQSYESHKEEIQKAIEEISQIEPKK